MSDSRSISPNFEKSITDRAVLTHQYFERKFGITAGDFSHGLLHTDQMWDKRPVAGWSDYRTPVAGLYMCGSSCHPGPGVTGIPGYNGANTALAETPSGRPSSSLYLQYRDEYT